MKYENVLHTCSKIFGDVDSTIDTYI